MAATKRKVKKKPASLAPRTVPGDPESGRGGITFLSQRIAGVSVNEDTAMTQTTVWACIKAISESLAGMPWMVGRLTKGTVDLLDDHDLNWNLNFAANPETPAFAFRETLWAWAIGWGNGYAEIERDVLQRPVNLWQIHPSRVRLIRTDAGTLLYEVQNDGESPSYLRQRDMFHLMGPSPDGLIGWSVIRMHARTIGLSIAQEENAASFNENDSTPGGLLIHPSRLGDTGRKNLEESWNRRHRGPKNRRTVAILEEGMKWEQTAIPPQEAQLVEQMQLTPSMICRIFRVPPHKIADLTRSTNNNIEHQDIEFVKDTLRPWAERGEGEADIKLLGRNNQGRLVTVIDLSERERGDTNSQTQHVKEMLFSGVYSINEGRKYLGLQSIGKEGDQRFIQSAMIPIEDAGKDLAAAEEKPDSEESRMSAVRERTTLLLVDACRRMMRRKELAQQQQGTLSDEWLAKHREYCREVIMPACNVLAACMMASGAAVDVAVSLFIEQHFQNPSDTPESAADQLMGYLQAAANAKGAA